MNDLDKIYCEKCGRRLSYPLRMVKVEDVDVQGRSMPIYGTSCCKAHCFITHDIGHDYGGSRPVNGQRIEHTELDRIVQLCCSISKSPRAIRSYTSEWVMGKGHIDIYYFDVKSKNHTMALEKEFNTHAPIVQLDRTGGFEPSDCGFKSC